MDVENLKKLRELTGVSVQSCKDALTACENNLEKATDYLRKKGELKAASKADRVASQGVVETYIHSNRKVGAMLILNCETDFVARNQEFISLARDIAMHITALNPQVISPDEVSTSLLDKEKEIWTEQLKNEGKNEKIIGQIIEGKAKKFREENALLTQKFVKNPELTVEQLIKNMIAKMGENIKVSNFSRFEI